MTANDLLAAMQKRWDALYVERKKVIELYAAMDKAFPRGAAYSVQESLYSLFGDKCLPDKEPSVQGGPKYKYNIGDTVTYKGKVKKVISRKFDCRGNAIYTCSTINGQSPLVFNEIDLEPYNEPETKEKKTKETQNLSHLDEQSIETKDNMEEKELNLCELLRDYKGEKIYILSHGYMTVMGGLVGTVGLEGTGEHGEVLNLMLNDDGTHIKGTEVIAFPSRALYEKYPLDAKAAWDEWAEERKPKRWRAKYGETYWCIRRGLIPYEHTADANSDFDRINYENGNMFHTEEEAHQAAEAVRECLMKFHEKKTASGDSLA